MRMRKASVVLATVIAGAAGACASAPLKKTDLAALAIADARELEGCYDCLIDARDTYARIGVGRARPLVVTRLFEIELLLALRAKELALDPAASFQQAQALAPELAPTVFAARYLDDISDVLPDDIGTPAADRSAAIKAHASRPADVSGEVEWLAAGPLREPVGQYLALSLDCSYPFRDRHGRKLFQPPSTAPPLVRYRAAICLTPDDDVLMAVRAEVPRFVETSYFLARRAVSMAAERGPGQARGLLAEAYARFPTSPSVTYLDGNFNQLSGDCRKALERFDETIALRPTHENGLLGRTECLSYLGRHDEAIAEATHMIDIDAKPTSALYWRAWNWRELKHLETARADIEAAKHRGFQSEVYRLAGMIEHDQDDLDPAEKDLQSVLHAAGGVEDCVAHWYLGLVYMKKARWVDSGAAFVGAYHCYQGAVAVDATKLGRLRARTDLDPDFQASQIAGVEATLAEDRSQQYAAAYNAANHYARGGDVVKARPLLDVAAEDPALADRVKQLRDIIK
jgi:tetratricopeptide (TPR) repeat protein